MIRIFSKNLNFVPGQNEVAVSGTYKDFALNQFVKDWLAYVGSKETITINKEIFGKLVDKYPPENFLETKLPSLKERI